MSGRRETLLADGDVGRRTPVPGARYATPTIGLLIIAPGCAGKIDRGAGRRRPPRRGGSGGRGRRRRRPHALVCVTGAGVRATRIRLNPSRSSSISVRSGIGQDRGQDPDRISGIERNFGSSRSSPTMQHDRPAPAEAQRVALYAQTANHAHQPHGRHRSGCLNSSRRWMLVICTSITGSSADSSASMIAIEVWP